MKVYVGYYITDDGVIIAFTMSRYKEEVEKYLMETFSYTFDDNNCYIEEYNLDERAIIFFD